MRDISPQSPEARRKRRAREQAHLDGRHEHIQSRWCRVTKRVAIGVYSDGLIHAGNLDTWTPWTDRITCDPFTVGLD